MIEALIQVSQERPLKLYASTKDWSEDYYQLTTDKTPFEKALFGGFTCQQFSFAFMAGYQAALEKMFPTIVPNELKALCVSEAKGGHPKAIQTTLSNDKITGVKTYITAGSEAAHLLVLCKTKEVTNGQPLLKMVHLPRTAQNLEITDFELPFMREVKHGKLALKDAKIAANQILEGDGYSDYTKPFRTLEDILVATAYQAMLLRQAMNKNWGEAVRDHLLLNIYTLKNLLTLPPNHRETHLLLTANEEQFKSLIPAIELNIANCSSAEFKEDWTMNKRVAFLGEKLKAIRLSKARKVLFGETK